MIDTIVIGDGPGGLSAALLLAKNGMKVVVFGQDKTAMHAALLQNYLGIESMRGSDFQRVARKQVQGFGAELIDRRAVSAEQVNGGFEIAFDDGERESARYLILSEGKGPKLARSLGLEHDEERGIEVDRNARTGIDGVYVVGRSARPGRSQAIISAGDGAAAAIDILSREQGKPFCDWDSPG